MECLLSNEGEPATEFYCKQTCDFNRVALSFHAAAFALRCNHWHRLNSLNSFLRFQLPFNSHANSWIPTEVFNTGLSNRDRPISIGIAADLSFNFPYCKLYSLFLSLLFCCKVHWLLVPPFRYAYKKSFWFPYLNSMKNWNKRKEGLFVCF